MVPSLPGARLGARVDEHTVKAELRLTLGRTMIPYRGTVRLDSSDREAGALALRLEAREGRGQGTARGTVKLRLRESRGSTTVSMHSEVEVQGRAEKAEVGDIRDSVQRLLSEFGENLERRLRGDGREAAALAGGLPRVEVAPPSLEAPGSPVLAGSPVSVADAISGSEEPSPDVEVAPPRIPGTVRVMTSEPVAAADVAPREGLLATAGDELRRRPWLVGILLGGLLLLLLGLRRRR